VGVISLVVPQNPEHGRWNSCEAGLLSPTADLIIFAMAGRPALGSWSNGCAARLPTMARRRSRSYPRRSESALARQLKGRWQGIIGQLTSPINARCGAVRETVSGDDALNAMRRELGSTQLHSPLIGEDLRLLVRKPLQIPIPPPDSE
jgi:hypothetical protein